MKLQVLSLCSGIGGFEIGARLANQRLGQEVFQLKALCEKNQFCRDRALKPNFPGIPIYEDIRDIAAKSGDYDLIVGGLPCQPFSVAGKKKGADDDRNLFPEFFRILCSVRPRGAVIENVPGLLAADSGRFFRDVLWQFAEAGYSVAWHVISCAEVGGVHLRERLWIIAYTDSQPKQESSLQAQPCGDRGATRMESERENSSDSNGSAAYTDGRQCRERQRLSEGQERKHLSDSIGICRSCINASSYSKGLEARQRCTGRQATIGEPERSDGGFDGQKETQSRVRGSHDGVSARMVRSYLMTPEQLPERLLQATDSKSIPYRKEMLQALGNAIVPDVAAIALYRFLEVSGLINNWRLP